jgi:hypothetical protein
MLGLFLIKQRILNDYNFSKFGVNMLPVFVTPTR